MEARELRQRQSAGTAVVRGLVTLAIWLGMAVVLAAGTGTAHTSAPARAGTGALLSAAPTALAGSDRCTQCEAFLAQAPVGRTTRACEELCQQTWPDYNCNWICTRLAELHSEGSESPCWDIGYCKEREIREQQEKQRREKEERERERLRREALEAQEKERERERRAKEEQRRRSEEAARLEIEQQRKQMEAGEVERERKLLKDEWAKLQREKETVARERHIVELEKKRLELIKARRPSDDGAEPTAEERQQALREKAKEALRVVEAKVNVAHSSGATSATLDDASPAVIPSSSPSAPVRQHAAEERATGSDAETKQQRPPSSASTQHPVNTQLRSVPSSTQQGAVWCAWSCSDLWTFNGLVKILVFFIAYILYSVALEWGEARVLNGVSEDFEAIQRQLRMFGFVSQLVAVILSGLFLFFGWMAFRHELSLPLLLAPLGQQCLTVAKYVPRELYLFLFLTGQVGKRLALAAKAGFEWWVRVKKILAAKRHLQGNVWARVAKDVATLRFAEYVFVLLFLVDSLVSKDGTENHACAEVAAYLLACEIAALLLNLAVTFPNRYIRQAHCPLLAHVISAQSFALNSPPNPNPQDVLTGISEAALFALLARFMTEAWGGYARLTMLSLPILVFRLASVVSLLRPTLVSLLSTKEKTS